MRADEKIKAMEEEIQTLRDEFHQYVKLKQQEESNRMKSALILAGGVILALVSFVWVEIIWPVIKMGRQ